VEIYHRQDGVIFCRVKVGKLGRSDVPLSATNRGIPLPIPESLLSYQSLQQLLTTYQAIMEARDDKTARATSPEQEIQTYWSQASVAIHDGQATRAMYTDHQSDLPKTGQSADERTGGG
jgi:hypothetical protein